MFPFACSDRTRWPKLKIGTQVRSRSNLSIVALATYVLTISFALATGVSFADDSPPQRVRAMCDFLGERPAYGCELIVAMEIKSTDGKLIATTARGGLRCSVAWLSSGEQSPQFVVATENGLIVYELER